MARELVNWDVIITSGALRDIRNGLMSADEFQPLTSSLRTGNDPRCTKINRIGRVGLFNGGLSVHIYARESCLAFH